MFSQFFSYIINMIILGGLIEMNKKHLMIVSVAGLALLAAGCSSQSSPTNDGNSSSLLTSKSSTKVSADNLSPQEMVSLVTTYAGNKYGEQWYQTAKDAKKDGLEVDLYPADHYKLSDNGQGVAYNVKASGKSSNLVYTVNGDNVTIYKNASGNNSGKKLTTVSRSSMVNTVNNQGQGGFVKQLSQNAQVNDKRGGSSSTSTSNDSSTKSGKYGNEGPVTVPSEMRGTWYSDDNDSSSTVTFGKNTFQYQGDDADGSDGSNSLSHLYKQNPSFAKNEDNMTDQGIEEATKNWSRTSFWDCHGMHWLNIQGWCQGAGDGSFFAVHTETIDGKKVKVLVQAGGATIATDAVYYQTQSLAHQNKDTKFDDLHYADDD